MINKPTKRLTVEIDASIHRNLTKAIKKIGTTKKACIEHWAKGFIVNVEGAPHLFDLLRERDPQLTNKGRYRQ
jgi:hypothetical protein